MATFNCPRCHSLITVEALLFRINEKSWYNTYNLLYKAWIWYTEQKHIQFLYKCNNDKCNTLIIRECINSEDYVNREFPSMPANFDFSSYPHISKISWSFIKFYNESYQVEQLWYKDIAWPWYRKALEFLIKDYLIKTERAKEDKIKNMLIWQCIENYIDDQRISDSSKRASWLWNDQTHYYKKREDKDLKDLKDMIILLLHYIENDLYYNEITKEMV